MIELELELKLDLDLDKYQYLYKFVLWIIFNILGTVIAKYSNIKIPLGTNLSKNSWLRKIFILQHDTKTGEYYFQITGYGFSGGRKYLHYKNLFLMYCVTFLLSNPTARYQFNQNDLQYVFITYAWIIGYGILETVNGMNLSITPKDFPRYTIQFKIWLIFVLFLTISLYCFHFYLALLEGGIVELVFYLSALVIVPCTLLYNYFYVVKAQPYFLKKSIVKNNAGWHIHHWFIGLFLSMFWRFNNPISKVAFSLYYAVFLEGSASGMSPIMYTGGDPAEG